MTNDENEDKKYKSPSDKLNAVFGLTPPTSNVPVVVETKETAVVPVPAPKDEQDYDDDFRETRDTLKELENTGKSVLDHFVQIAKDSESPRAMEVLGGFMEKLSNISLAKLDIHDKKKKRKDDGKPNGAPGSMNIENANIIVGTTADMLQHTKK